MNEYQYIVMEINGELWYTAQFRKVHFLWRGRWQDITPKWHRDFEDAKAQVRKHYIDNL